MINRGHGAPKFGIMRKELYVPGLAGDRARGLLRVCKGLKSLVILNRAAQIRKRLRGIAR
jgi:hypothetical protein